MARDTRGLLLLRFPIRFILLFKRSCFPAAIHERAPCAGPDVRYSPFSGERRSYRRIGFFRALDDDVGFFTSEDAERFALFEHQREHRADPCGDRGPGQDAKDEVASFRPKCLAVEDVFLRQFDIRFRRRFILHPPLHFAHVVGALFGNDSAGPPRDRPRAEERESGFERLLKQHGESPRG